MIITSMRFLEKSRGIRKICLVVASSFLGVINDLGAQTASIALDSTQYFSFHNNYWMNLHHFLYQKASGSQLSKLQQDGDKMFVIGEKAVEESLYGEQRSTLDSAISYYKNNLIQRGLLRGLGYERYWLQKQVGFEAIADTTVSQEFVDVMNHVSKTYKETYWPIHKKHNEEILEYQIANIRQLEKGIIPRMVGLSLTPWPSGEKVRVDLTTYANYAGAYTPTRPIFNVVVSTIDPRSNSPDFLETIFHEGSHLLFRYGGPWREHIFQTYDAGDYKMKFPRHLWHVSLFYLCGQVCKEEFAKIGITNYEMTMFTRNIFKTYHYPELFGILDNYMMHALTLDATATELLQVLELKSEK
ncbi:MAG: hypothetical protein AAGH81_18545 [Bacteroidota bacterium]